MRKNVADKLTVYAWDTTTGLPKTGDAANLTAYVNKDHAGVNALADTSASEDSSTNAKGYYTFDIAQAETNADKLVFSANSSTADIAVLAVPAVVRTRPTNEKIFLENNGVPIAAGEWLGAIGATQSSVVTIAANVVLVKAVTDKVATGLVLAVDDTWQHTAVSLELGPAAVGLTSQETRDALKLAPTAGAPAAGSVDTLLGATVKAGTAYEITNVNGVLLTTFEVP